MAGATPETESGICQCPTMSLGDTENSIRSKPMSRGVATKFCLGGGADSWQHV